MISYSHCFEPVVEIHSEAKQFISWSKAKKSLEDQGRYRILLQLQTHAYNNLRLLTRPCLLVSILLLCVNHSGDIQVPCYSMSSLSALSGGTRYTTLLVLFQRDCSVSEGIWYHSRSPLVPNISDNDDN